MKPFSELNHQEILELTDDQIRDSIKIEAINRIKIPVTLSEAIFKTGFRGHVHSNTDVSVYVLASDGYSDQVGWLSEAEALRAMQGAVVLENTYNKGVTGKNIIPKSSVVVKRVRLQSDAQLARLVEIDKFVNDQEEEFDRLVDECSAIVLQIRQDAYNKKVAIERQAEYMRLAGGDAEIAKAFWDKAESLPWIELESVVA
jgi:hypothetical protein